MLLMLLAALLGIDPQQLEQMLQAAPEATMQLVAKALQQKGGGDMMQQLLPMIMGLLQGQQGGQQDGQQVIQALQQMLGGAGGGGVPAGIQ